MSRWPWNTVIEPFRIKSVEPIGFPSEEEREHLLRDSGYNLFKIPADKVIVDLLTDSGNSAMSSEQWAGIMRGDESYAGAKSFYVFEKKIKEITGYREVIPVHQGRAAERVMFSFLGGGGKVFLANSHFDTTRANIEATGATAVDLPVPEAADISGKHPFKGDIDAVALASAIREHGAQAIPMVIMTVTNNSAAGQPVSMRNLREASEICGRYKIPFILDAARFAENAYFIKLREHGYKTRSIRDIAREMFSYASGCLMSAKKDALANIGGFIALNNSEWAEKAKEAAILTDGFPTYGGLAGRDLEAIARGIDEGMDENYLEYRHRSIEYLAEGLRRAGVPIVEPPGGHAVYVDACAFLNHIPPGEYPAQALACELYRIAAIRTFEVGSISLGKRHNGTFVPSKMEWLRLAIPRRVYTQSHMDYVVEVFGDVAKRKKTIRGLRWVGGAERLPQFNAKLAPAH